MSDAGARGIGRGGRSARGLLSSGASGIALLAVPAALAVGVALSAGAAQAQGVTVNPVQQTSYQLTPAKNPITFGAGTMIGVPNAAGVYGNAGTDWTLANHGVIQGRSNGIQLQSQSLVTNSGSIAGAAGSFGAYGTGVALSAGGSVTNEAGGRISGSGLGIRISGAAGTVTNAGNVSGGGTYTAAILLSAGGSVANEAGGTINGVGAGVELYRNGGIVTNEAGATINGFKAGVNLYNGGGTVTNKAGARINGVQDGVKGAGAAGTVMNAGTISATGTNGSGGVGIGLYSGGSITNAAGGTIGGNDTGIFTANAAGMVTNAGAIAGTLGTGVRLFSGGSVANQGGGTISGYGNGILLDSGGSVTNEANATISGVAHGVVTYSSVATVTNAGTISAAMPSAATSNVHGTGVQLNAGGSVTNLAGGTISGGYGVVTYGGAKVTNAGTITGSVLSVYLSGPGANLLTLETGSVLNGAALGSTAAGATTALVLQGTGTADNDFLSFTTLNAAPGAAWTLGGTNTIAATTVENGARLQIGSALHPAASITGTSLALNPGSTLAIGITPDANGALNMTGEATLAGSLALVPVQPGV